MSVLSKSKPNWTAAIRAGREEAGNAEWPVSRSILSFGVRIKIRTNTPEVLDQLSKHFPPLWKPSSAADVDRLFSLKVGGAKSRGRSNSLHELFEESEMGIRTRSMSAVLEDLERRIKMYVAEMARRRVFVHAGVVGWQERAILVPGRSLSGKSTLVAQLVRAGATYYSDEYAVLDVNGRVHPYPQPLALRRPGSAKQKKCRAEDIGGATGSRPLPVGLVIAARYESGQRWHPERLSDGQAVLELLDNTIPARRKPEMVLAALKSTVSGAVVLKGSRGEARETAALILKDQRLYSK